MVDIHIGAREQFPDDFYMTALGGGDQGGAAKAIGQPGIRLGLNRQFQDLQQALCPGIQEWIVQAVIADVDVGARLNERPHRVDPVAVGGCHDRRAPLGIAPIDLGAFLEQFLDGGRIAGLGCADELGRQDLDVGRRHGGGGNRWHNRHHRGVQPLSAWLQL